MPRFLLPTPALALVATLASSPALAESFVLSGGTLEVQGNVVAEISRAPVRVEWRPHGRALVSYADDVLALRGEIRARRSDDHLLVGVGAEVLLTSSTGWRVAMLANTWAPAVGGRGGWTEVALPRGFPIASGWLAPGAPPAAPGSWQADRWPVVTDEAALALARGANAGDRAEAQRYCVDSSRIGRVPWDPAPWITVGEHSHAGEILALTPDKRWARVLFAASGFAVEGYARVWRDPAACPAQLYGVGGTEGGVACGDGMIRGREVWLAPGDKLYPRPWRPGLEPFAVVRGRLLAREVAAPPSPVDPNQVPGSAFLIEHRQAGVEIALNAYLDRPNRDLGPVDRLVTHGVGGCTSTSSQWPPAWY